MHDTSDSTSSSSPAAPDGYVNYHLRLGWWTLLLFLSLGGTLEAMLAFKVQWYVNVANETRRLMWTLAHAHGTLLALVNIGYAGTLRILPPPSPKWLTVTSTSLTAATVLLPGGFLLGGIRAVEGDPGMGILLVPCGAALLFLAILLTALHASRA